MLLLELPLLLPTAVLCPEVPGALAAHHTNPVSRKRDKRNGIPHHRDPLDEDTEDDDSESSVCRDALVECAEYGDNLCVWTSEEGLILGLLLHGKSTMLAR